MGKILANIEKLLKTSAPSFTELKAGHDRFIICCFSCAGF